MIPPELLTAFTGLLVGVGGFFLGLRRTKTEAVAATSPVEMAGYAFDAQRQWLTQLSADILALKAEVRLLTAENTKLRSEVVQLRTELEIERRERHP